MASTYSYSELEQLWTKAGGQPALAPIMAAIALAESSGNMDAVDHDSNGTTDYGLWQINSSHEMYDPGQLVSDALYNARAAVSIEQTQGLTAWTTYTSGAYERYYNNKSTPHGNVQTGFALTYPDGQGSDVSDVFASYTQSLDTGNTIQGLENDDSNIMNAIEGSITGPVDFMQFLTKLLMPQNWVRLLEVTVGTILMLLGIELSISRAVANGRDIASNVSQTGVGKAISTGVMAIPQARAISAAARTQRGLHYGRQAARAESSSRDFQSAVERGYKAATKKTNQRHTKAVAKRTAKKYGEEPPF